jgi:protein tyrosine phosphatase (PTP) superfamily phosphohydrolase (DUF442 family)
MLLPFILPALVFSVADHPIPGAVEVCPRIFVFKGAPNDTNWADAKTAGITHVLCVRRDGEAGFSPDRDQRVLTMAGISYMRLALGRAPSSSDLDLFRDIMRDLPPDTKLLIHCGDGNRAAALAFTWMVLDRHIPYDQALSQAKLAGLALPETEQAVRKYVEKRQKS